MPKRNMISVSVKKLEDYIAGVNYQTASKMIGASHDYMAMVIRNQKRGKALMSEKYFDKFCETFGADPEDLKTSPKKKSVTDEYKQLELEWDDDQEEIKEWPKDTRLLLKDAEIKLIEISSLLMNIARVNLELYEDIAKIGEDEDVSGTES